MTESTPEPTTMESSTVNPDAGFALIVNYLPPSFTDQDLHNLFADVGPLYSAKIMRNKHTNSSFGYGFVNYVKKEDADRAIEKKDGEKVLHKQIRVAFSRRAEGPDAIKNANLFVGNLPLAWKEADLERTFKQYGKVIKCKVLIDQLTGVSRGCGFVLFSKTAEADVAIQDVDGKKPSGCEKPLLVKRNNLQEESKAKFNVASSKQTVAKEVHVIHHYTPYPTAGYPGYPSHPSHPTHQAYAPAPSDKFPLPHVHHHPTVELKSHQYVPGNLEKYPPAYGYPIEFTGNGDMPYAMPHMPSMPVVASQRSSLGPPHSLGGHGHSLFVYNIGPECTELDLYQLFGPYGAIIKAHIQRDQGSGKSKGFGFVTYNEREEAMHAIASLHGYAWEKNDYRQLQVSFKKDK